MRYVVT